MLLATGSTGTLTELWPEAAAKAAGTDDSAREVLTRTAESLHVDGELLDCSRALSGAPHHACLAGRSRREGTRVPHAGRPSGAQAVGHPARRFRPFGGRPAAGGPAARVSALRTAMCSTFPRCRGWSPATCPRINCPRSGVSGSSAALSLLRNQPFYPGPKGAGSDVAPYAFVFDNCAAAIEAHRARLPQLVEVVKAIAIAELEARGGYVEADHDPFFERYDEDALTAEDLAQFPDYLVCIPARAQ